MPIHHQDYKNQTINEMMNASGQGLSSMQTVPNPEGDSSISYRNSHKLGPDVSIDSNYDVEMHKQ